MPLQEGYSREAISQNIKREMDEKNTPQKQAVAIALTKAREAAKRAGQPHKGPGPPPDDDGDE